MGQPRRVALVTGCAGGIGAAVCLQLLTHGVIVYATDLPSRSLLSFIDGSDCRYIQLDVTQPSQVKACVSRIMAEQGRIDLLFNIAGIMVQGPAAEVPIEATQQAFEVNVFGQMRLVQAVTPYMIKQKTGTIVNMGSVLGFTGMPFLSTYSASKAALQSFTDAVRVELSPFGIHVHYVAPGKQYGTGGPARASLACHMTSPFVHGSTGPFGTKTSFLHSKTLLGSMRW